jgi:cobalt-zinc-cadmium resistance protein CzcA
MWLMSALVMRTVLAPSLVTEKARRYLVVMMLKGANSKQVINDVKVRIAETKKSLPDGVYINGFLERSELVETTFTVENLILGCLIVIFCSGLLLGNWRSGLVVASVIPLCLLFAISLMNIFELMLT